MSFRLVIALSFLVATPFSWALPKDPHRSPMWSYNVDRYLGEDVDVVLDAKVRLKVPDFAEDSAQVPLTLDLSALDFQPRRVVSWVDLNPIPHLFSLKPRARIDAISLNFRVQQATTVRGAVLDQDGVWHVGSAYLDAAGGGCTTPSLASAMPDWEERFGRIRGGAFSRGPDHQRLKFRVHHPMDSGMVGNIPAFHIETVKVQGAGEEPLLRMSLSESAAENPMFAFDIPDVGPKLRIQLRDNNGNRFERQLEAAL